MNMTFLNFKVSFTSLALLASMTAYALPSDQRQPINIEADQAFFDQQKGEANYEGNVVATQGTIVIKAEQLSIVTDTQTGDLKALHATGTPSNFSQQIDASGRMMNARGNTLDYDVTIGQLEIHDSGYLKRGEDEISADYILYLLNNATFKAENRGTGRVNMTLQPSITESAD